MKPEQKASILLLLIFSLAVSQGMMAKPQSGADPKKVNISKLAKKTFPPREPAVAVAEVESASASVVVAVIDTGFDPKHTYLKSHRWQNPGERGIDSEGRQKSSNGHDDDGNGFIDDVEGFDFVSGQGLIADTHGHGTHIAGIIAKHAPKARLMNLKYFDREIDGVSALRNSIEAIKYAIQMKVDIINYSGGGTIPSREELKALKEAQEQGILVVAAAGNEGSNSEREPFFPANYKLTNILSVTAIDTTGLGAPILPTSNFGAGSVAVAAMGKDVVSTLPGNRFGPMTGTSQATAFAAAVAANIILESRERLEVISPEEVIERIVVSSRVSQSLNGKTRFGSKLEGRRALAFRSESRSKRLELERSQFLQAFQAELSTTESQASVNPLSKR